MNIFISIPFILFWAAVFSFVPSAIYLIINPLESIEAEKLSSKNIFVIKKEVDFEREKKRRRRGICIIYGICVVVMVCLFVINWTRSGTASVMPIDIVSALSVILFSLAVLTYFPVVIYLVVKDPWRYKKEGVYLRTLFIAYGNCIFVFSVIYVYQWLKNKGIFIDRLDLLASLFICVIAASCISYLPVLTYILIKSRKSVAMCIRPSIIFMIFSISFILFSGLYVHDWILDKTIYAELSF